MAQTVKDAITGRKKTVIRDNKLYDAITGRQLGFFRNGYLVSFSTGRNLEWITISDGADVSGVTAAAGDVAADKFFVNADGDLIPGSLTDVTAEIYDNVVIVPPGVVRERQSFTVPEAMPPKKDSNTLTVYKGYIPQDIVFNLSGGMDISDATVTADNMLAGVIGYNADGTRYVGNIPTVAAALAGNVVTVPAGYIAAAQTLTVAEMTEPALSANVVTISKGYNKVQKTVTVPEAGAISVIDNVVTVPVGYIKSQRTATVAAAAAPSTSGNVVTVYKGYQAEQKKITVGTSVAAKTYTPGTADQTIAAGSYLAGKQTIKGDSNLVAGNIAEGITIFGVSGSFKGGVTLPDGIVVTPADVRFGVNYIDGNGLEQMGTMPDYGVAEIELQEIPHTLPAGYYERIDVPAEPPAGTDTSDATISSADVRFDKIAYGKNGKIIGTMDELVASPIIIEEAGSHTLQDGYYEDCTIEVGCDTLDEINIRAGVNVMGVDGTFSADATATADDILSGKTAAVNGKMITGTLVPESGTPSGEGIAFYECSEYIPDFAGGTQYSFILSGAADEAANGTYTCIEMEDPVDEYNEEWRLTALWENENGYKFVENYGYGEFTYEIRNVSDDTLYQNDGPVWSRPATFPAYGTDIPWADCIDWLQITLTFAAGPTTEIPPTTESWSGYLMQKKFFDSIKISGINDSRYNFDGEYVGDGANATHMVQYFNSDGHWLEIFSVDSSYLAAQIRDSVDAEIHYKTDQFVYDSTKSFKENLLSYTGVWRGMLNFSYISPTLTNSSFTYWEKTSTLKSGMLAGGFTPEVGGVYSEDTVIACDLYRYADKFLEALYHFDNETIDATGKTKITSIGEGWYKSNSDAKFGNGSMEADCYMHESGSSSYYLDISGLPEMDAFTIEWWQKDDSNMGDGGYILSQPETDNLPVSVLPAYKIPHDSSDYAIHVYRHWAFVRKAGSSAVDVYLNGKKMGSVEFAAKFGGRLVKFTGVSSYSGTQVKNARIDELAIYSTAKYTADFVPANKPTVI